MGLGPVSRLLTAVAVLLASGCVGVAYRERATVAETRYATLENFSDREIDAEQVDGLLEEVAGVLHLRLEPGKPRVRIIVTSPARVAEVYRRAVTVAAHGADAVALYFPGANLVLVSEFDRAILGHELAHYLTDHYLKGTPRKDWERIARTVEDRLPRRAPTLAAAPTPGPVVAAHPVGPIAGTAY
jgi:hypothetical protein